VSSIERCYPIDSASCPDRQHRVIVGRAQMRGVERGVPRTRRSGTTMIASPRNTACRARSANLSGAMGRNVSADLMSSSSLTLSFRPYTPPVMIGVRTTPGQSTETCTPWRSASSRNASRVRRRRAWWRHSWAGSLLRRYRLELARPGYQPRWDYGGMPIPVDGMPIVLRPQG
jgi:hypothetical protein